MLEFVEYPMIPDLSFERLSEDLMPYIDKPGFLELLATWGPCPGCPTDLDGDGLVGITDLLALLAAWGPC